MTTYGPAISAFLLSLFVALLVIGLGAYYWYIWSEPSHKTGYQESIKDGRFEKPIDLSREIKIEPGDVSAFDGSTINIGIFGLLGDEDRRRRKLQKRLAPWLFDDEEIAHCQPALWRQRDETCAPGTGLWLTEGVLQQWLRSPKDLLWISGPLGCGKSILASSTIKKLRECSQERNGSYILAFALYSWDIKYTWTPDFLVRTILALLCSLNPIPPSIADIDHKLDMMSSIDYYATIEKTIAFLNAKDKAPEQKHPQAEAKSLLIVVDAIDELTVRSDRIRALQSLNRVCGLNEKLIDAPIRVILFSRQDDDVMKICVSQRHSDRVEVPQPQIDSDIQLAMQSRMTNDTNMRGLSSAEISDIATNIRKKAEGCFGLASEYMDNLERAELETVTPIQLKSVLRGLPVGLFASYERIIRKIETSPFYQQIFAALRLILFAADQLYVDDVIDIGATLLNTDDEGASLFETKLRLTRRNIMKFLSELVLFDTTSHSPASPAYGRGNEDYNASIRIKNFSVAEFLLSANTGQWSVGKAYFQPSLAQYALTCQCFAYMIHCWKHNYGDQPVMTYLPFLSYARLFWFRHAAAYILTLKGSNNKSPQTRSQPSRAEVQNDRTAASSYALRVMNTLIAPSLYTDKAESDFLESRLLDIAASILKLSGDETPTISSLVKVISGVQSCEYILDDISTEKTNDTEDDKSSRYLEDITAEPENIATIYEHRLDLYPQGIRLMLVAPSEDPDAPLDCHLVVDSIQNKGEYAAIAHMWEYGTVRSIIVGGESLAVEENLYEAVRTSRLSDRVTALWVDAICINMRDIGERGQQIQMMGDIFHSADQVIAWLGTPIDSTIQSLEYLKSPKLQQLLTEIGEGHNAVTAKDARQTLLKYFRSFCLIMNLSLWDRFWIYTEISLARTVQVQSSAIAMSLDELLGRGRKLLDLFGHVEDAEMDKSLTSKAIKIENLLSKVRDRTNLPKLPELLYLMRQNHCSVAHDKFFGLIGMLSGKELSDAQRLVNYAQSAREIFLEVATLLLESYKGLEILSINNVELQESTAWPPQWDREIYEHPLSPGVFVPSQPELYNVLGKDFEETLHHISSGAIYVAAIHLDEVLDSIDVQTLIDDIVETDSHSPTESIGSSTSRITRGHGKKISNGHPISHSTDGAWQTKFGRERLLRIIREDRVIHSHRDINFSRMDNGHRTNDMWDSRLGNRINRKIFRTSTGLLGNGPKDIRSGDVVMIFQQAKVPHIVRQHSKDEALASQQEVQLIGECYVDGMMDGAVLDGIKRGDYRWRDVEIINVYPVRNAAYVGATSRKKKRMKRKAN